MIVLRKFKIDDLKNLEELFKGNNIEVNLPNQSELIYLGLLDHELIGAIKANEKEGIWTLDYIYIEERWRNQSIGDGLLRVIIDNLDKKEIKRLYCSQINQYLIKKGFEEYKDDMIYLNIEGFFNNRCCGDKNEI